MTGNRPGRADLSVPPWLPFSTLMPAGQGWPQATREALDRMTAGCYLLCLPQEISGNQCWSPENFLYQFCFLFHCPLDGKQFRKLRGSFYIGLIRSAGPPGCPGSRYALDLPAYPAEKPAQKQSSSSAAGIIRRAGRGPLERAFYDEKTVIYDVSVLCPGGPCYHAYGISSFAGSRRIAGPDKRNGEDAGC